MLNNIREGLRPHDFKLKINAIVMLIRNISITGGMCNGQRGSQRGYQRGSSRGSGHGRGASQSRSPWLVSEKKKRLTIQFSASVGAAYREKKKKEKNTWLAKECKNKKNTNMNRELNISSSDRRKNF